MNKYARGGEGEGLKVEIVNLKLIRKFGATSGQLKME